MPVRPRRRVTVCLSHLRWNFVFQRPQHLMTRAAEEGDVVFLEEPVAPAAGAPAGVRVARPAERVEVLTPVCAPGEALEAQTRILREALARRRGSEVVFWYMTPMALPFSGGFRPDVTVYDCMDELSAFRGAPPELVRLEAELFRRADLVFTGGPSLFRAKRALRPDAHCFPSSVDRDHFLPARLGAGPAPADQTDLPRPRVGFFGVIDERMDLQLVDRLAALRPGWSFVMVGPTAKIDDADLPSRPNLHWLGPKDYAELPAYLAGWDAGFMPFAMNEATRFISPTKTPEFLSAGVPTVSTPIADVVDPWGRAGLVRLAADPAEFAAALEAAMATDRTSWLARVDARLAGDSWDRTWSAMRDLIEAALAREPARAGRAATPAARRPDTRSG